MAPRYEITSDHLRHLKEHTPVGDYFTINDDQESVRLHDIVTLEPLEGTETPPGILTQPDLRYGMDVLQEFGEAGNPTIQLILARHGKAAHFIDLYSKYGIILDQAPAIALEMSGYEDYAPSFHVTPQLTSPGGRRRFQEAQLQWAGSANKLVLPCELTVNDNSKLRASFDRLWNDVYMTMAYDDSMPLEIKNAGAFLAEAVYQRSRQPAILARLGYLTGTFRENGQLPRALSRLPLILGSWHENSGLRLADLGVPFETYTADTTLVGEEQLSLYGKALMSMTYTSQASLESLGIIRPYTV